jgi:N-acetyl-1-D-myo-inositol-2-amino-2-deoxy-alpha-D-glucopyranoside deacetylase/mycothiol S-conjugate amidase
VLRLAANQGHTTILVTCTNGELGDVKGPALRLTPHTHLADRQRLANIRRQELARASTILGVSHLYMLGYHDSGMQGWETNAAPQAFAQADGEVATARVVEILRRHRPHVVITYDAHGGYGHPDHIMAHRITVAAVEAAADTTRFVELGAAWHVPKFYHTAWARSELLRVFKVLHWLGRQTPLRDAKFDPNDWGCPDALITTRIDVRSVMRAKWQALFTHRSQMGRGDFFWWFLRLTGRWLYPYESFCCVQSSRPITPPETDIFADL